MYLLLLLLLLLFFYEIDLGKNIKFDLAKKHKNYYYYFFLADVAKVIYQYVSTTLQKYLVKPISSLSPESPHSISNQKFTYLEKLIKLRKPRSQKITIPKNQHEPGKLQTHKNQNLRDIFTLFVAKNHHYRLTQPQLPLYCAQQHLHKVGVGTGRVGRVWGQFITLPD